MSNAVKPPEHPVLSPPRAPSDHKKKDGKLAYWAKWLALFLLVILAVGVIWFLPSVKSPSSNDKQQASSAGPYRQQMPLEEQLALKGAKKSRQIWYEQKAMAELHNMQLWGEKEYKQAITTGKYGLRLLKRGEFDLAASTFLKAASLLASLEKTKYQIRDQALLAGQAALSTGDQAEAKRQFQIVLAIEPSNTAARLGIQRAHTTRKVFEMVDKAKEKIGTADLHEACHILLEALKIDPHFKPASELLKRVKELQKKQLFKKEIGCALAELAAGNFSQCRRHLEKAAEIFPDDPAVGQLASQLNKLEKASSVQVYMKRAQKYSSEERWREAISQYDRALAIDNKFLPALEGRENAKKMEAIYSALSRIIDHPERLRDTSPFEDAKRTIKAVSQLNNPGPKLREMTKEATKVVEMAAVPVPITFISDGQTMITVFHVGRLGALHKKTIALRPGRYVVLGTRPGYRDVRKEIVVKAGQSPAVIHISCSEKI